MWQPLYGVLRQLRDATNVKNATQLQTERTQRPMMQLSDRPFDMSAFSIEFDAVRYAV